MKKGDLVSIQYGPQRVNGMIVIASENEKSLMLGFEALIGGHVTMMPVLMDDEGVYRSIVTNEPVNITKIERPSHLTKPHCHKCTHRRSLPGNSHSACAHPKAMEVKSVAGSVWALAAAFGGPPVNPGILGVIGDEHGIRRGWFGWPFNFDPTWLLACDGFEEKGE